MANFTIDFNNGFEKKITADNLEEVKEVAFDLIGYTQSSIDILDENDEVVTSSTWYSEDANKDDPAVLEVVGNGHYQIWSDELE